MNEENKNSSSFLKRNYLILIIAGLAVAVFLLGLWVQNLQGKLADANKNLADLTARFDEKVITAGEEHYTLKDATQILVNIIAQAQQQQPTNTKP